jgi:hypothetical protein
MRRRAWFIFDLERLFVFGRLPKPAPLTLHYP